ncbi:MAG: energy transducer TonB [Bacteroidales bacterium]|nr:energy transducer TonB [Bacteroidales bacterium]
MNYLFVVRALIVSCLLHGGLTAQQWVRPKPLMDRNVLKTFREIHLEYPLEARENKVQGTVVIGFSVDEKGNVTERHILQSVYPPLDSSALRLFDLILWSPAKLYGKGRACPASENSGFSVTFNARKYKKLINKRGYDQLPQPFTPIDTGNRVYRLSQLGQAPEFDHGATYKTLNDFIYKQVSYPEEAVRLNISGTVRLSLVIETSGLPSNIVVKEAVGGGCTGEAIRVLQKMRWMPGRKDGHAVRTHFELSVKFENPAQLKNKNIPNQTNSGI